jgi:hypothetical protein
MNAFLSITTSEMRTVALLIFLISLIIGGVFFLWPAQVQKYDERMSSFFASAETHRAFIRGFGMILLCLAAASLLATVFS